MKRGEKEYLDILVLHHRLKLKVLGDSQRILQVMGASPSKPQQLSVVVAPAVGEKGEIRRIAANRDHLTTPTDLDPSISNTYDLLLRGLRVSEKAPCLGEAYGCRRCFAWRHFLIFS